MEEKPDLIEFTSEEGDTVLFSVAGQVSITGTDYLLVTDSNGDGDGEDAYILKKLKDKESQSIYVMVSDDEELSAISKVFEETLEDIDIEMEN
ncbi:MAG: DUF1292 domain-containing protein [Lachnospiraceae bacterium]|nr:DUF1292 domain-containing protein [Lachnospiraceae bacterium]